MQRMTRDDLIYLLPTFRVSIGIVGRDRKDIFAVASQLVRSNTRGSNDEIFSQGLPLLECEDDDRNVLMRTARTPFWISDDHQRASCNGGPARSVIALPTVVDSGKP